MLNQIDLNPTQETRVTGVKVYETTNYGMFRSLFGNRQINLAHVDNIKRSMKDKLLPTIITINEKGEIIDGQHRFEALKLLNQPIHFVMERGLTREDAIRLNVDTRKWSLMDFIDSYISMGFEDYMKLKEYHKQYKYPITAIAAIMQGRYSGSSSSTDIKNGKFAITTPEKVYKKILEGLVQIEENTKERPNNTFVCSIIQTEDPVDVVETLAKKSKHYKIRYFRSVNQMKSEIQDAYNYNRKRAVVKLYR